MSRVQARHQHAPRRRADIRPAIELVELHSFRGDTVDVRRANFRLPIAATMPAPQIVGHDEHDVRRSALGACAQREQRKYSNNAYENAKISRAHLQSSLAGTKLGPGAWKTSTTSSFTGKQVCSRLLQSSYFASSGFRIPS